MLNLTVATVGQTYAVVKKEADTKRAKQDAEDAIKKKIQAERDEMAAKNAAENDKNDDDEDDDENDDVPLIFDASFVLKLWCSGPLTLGMGHRIYLKDWRNGSIVFVLRLLSCNMLMLGWLTDGVRLEGLNRHASALEREAKIKVPTDKLAYLRTEKVRVESIPLSPLKQYISVILAYPYLKKQMPFRLTLVALDEAIEETRNLLLDLGAPDPLDVPDPDQAEKDEGSDEDEDADDSMR